MNKFNQRTAMNYRLRTGLDEQLAQDAAETTIQQVMARKRIAGRKFDAALREYQKSISLNTTLICVMGVGLGVLIGLIV